MKGVGKIKITRLYLLLPLLLLLATTSAFAQRPDPADAKEHFKNHNYFAAQKSYERLLKYEPKNPKYLRQLALCHMRLNIDKTQAIKHLEKCVAQPKHDPEARFELGQAYTYADRFEEAAEAFESYKANAAGNADNVAKADKAISNCLTARELMKTPINVTFENMGDKINTQFPDYYPFVSKDGAFLIFTSRREANKGTSVEFDGYYSSDIWYVDSREEGWANPKNFGAVNTRYDEQAVGMDANGDEVFVYVDQFSSSTGQIFGDIYSVKKKNNKFARKEKLEEPVNSKKFESSACMSADGNTLFFASDRPGGQGGLDIWMARRLPNGLWAMPMNLGPEINTAFDEDFPTLSNSGRILYFSSKGLPGMGGSDLFKASWQPEEGIFDAPINLGYPLNTPMDDMTISFTSDSTTAYVSALRPNGQGDLDIYRVTFNEVESRPAVFIMQMQTGDSLAPFAEDAFVVVFDETGEEIGTYSPNRSTGNVVLALHPGFYTVEIEVEGFELKVIDLNVTDFHVRIGEIKKSIYLSP